MKPRKIICLEFNELCPHLLQRWMAAGKLRNFQHFFAHSQVFRAIADESGPENLEPWIQWYSMHTGLSYRQHGVQNLTDGPHATHRDIWQMLNRNGRRAATCASMNVRGFGAPGAFYLPDPWCTSEKPFPEPLAAFQQVIARLVHENSRGASPLSFPEYVRFMTFMLTHGLRVRTVTAVARQVWSDTVMQRGTQWRRAPLHDRLQFDVFRHYWRKEHPDFSSFFLNSTAHYQHSYWHCAFPEEFDSPPDADQVRRFGSAILFGYQQMDRLLEDFFALERDDAMLILCTALSQQSSKMIDRAYYRLTNLSEFLRQLGIAATRVLPVMAEQYNAEFDDQPAADAAAAAIASLQVDGQPLFFVGRSDARCLFFGAGLRREISSQLLVTGFPDGVGRRFDDLFYRLPNTKAATHHPESLIWVKTGQHRVHRETVSILDMVPTLLDYYGIARERADPGNAMSGRSLLPTLQN